MPTPNAQTMATILEGPRASLPLRTQSTHTLAAATPAIRRVYAPALPWDNPNQERLSNVVDGKVNIRRRPSRPSSVVVVCDLDAVLELHAGEHVSDELVAVDPAPALLGGVEQLV